METLPELGDVNFFYVVQEHNNIFAREAILPTWASLAFVQSDRAYPLGGDTGFWAVLFRRRRWWRLSWR